MKGPIRERSRGTGSNANGAMRSRRLIRPWVVGTIAGSLCFFVLASVLWRFVLPLLGLAAGRGLDPSDWVPPLVFFICAIVSVVFGLGIARKSRRLRIVSIGLVAVLFVAMIAPAVVLIVLFVFYID